MTIFIQNFITPVQQHLKKEIPYPRRYRPEGIVRTVTIQFFALFVFLLLFKPFGVYEPEHKFSYILICIVHALSPAVLILSYFSTLNYLFQQRKSSTVWTHFMEYSHLAVVFLLIGVASFLFRGLIYDNPDNWSGHYLWEEIRNCYLAGILSYFILLSAGFYRKPATAAASGVQEINLDPHVATGKAEQEEKLFIKTQVQMDDFSFNPAQLIFAKAEGNYTALRLCINDLVSTELKRISLKEFEAQLGSCPYLFRCHRSYLVNILKVKKISGNAQGYTLLLQQTQENVSVSRTQLPLFKIRYAALTATQTA